MLYCYRQEMFNKTSQQFDPQGTIIRIDLCSALDTVGPMCHPSAGFVWHAVV